MQSMEEATEMEMELAESYDFGEADIGMSVMNRFRNSSTVEHKQLRAVVSAVREVLIDQGLPTNSTAYFAAVMSSLDQQLAQGSVLGADTTAFFTFLAILLPKLSNPLVRSRSQRCLELLTIILKINEVPAGTVKAGLSCLEGILSASDKSNWLALAVPFNILLKFTNDERPKVRKRAQQCCGEVLSSFNGTNALEKASEAAGSYFQRYYSSFIGEGSKDQPKDAAQVLYVLGALRHVLPAMSLKSISKMLPGLLLLFKLKQQLVTTHVLNLLLALSRRSRKDLPGNDIADATDAVCSLVSAENRAVDEVVTAIHALEQLLGYLHDISPSLCAAKLAAAFDAIAELFASEHEIPFGAADCLRNIISKCVDDALIKQGVQSLEARGKRKGTATPIQRICSTVERSLSYQYSSAWDTALLVVSALFKKLGPASFPLMSGVVASLAQLQELKDDDMPYRKQLAEAFGAAIVAMGPEKFLTLLPLDINVPDLSRARVWPIPLLKQYIVGGSLRYFAENVAPVAENLTKRAKQYNAQGESPQELKAEACAYALWALLPAFCNYPVDTKENFRLIAKLLGDTMKNNAKVRGIICSSMQILIKQNVLACKGMSKNTEETETTYSKEEASANLSAIAAFSDKFLPLLFNLFLEAPPDRRGELQALVGDISSISSKPVVQKVFRSVLEKLLQATKEVGNDKRCMLMDLALSMAQGLDLNGLSALFAVAKPALQDTDSKVQKKGYKILATICKEQQQFLSQNSQEIFDLIQKGTLTCQNSSKQYRILCLQSIIVHLVKDGSENSQLLLGCLLKEAVIALKEVNKKTRNAAFDLLLSVGQSLQESSEEELVHFFRMVVGCSAVSGSAGEPHAISAAITAISRLVYEFPNELALEVRKYLPSAYFLLNNYKAREVIKALLGLLKVVVARLSKEELSEEVKEMVPTMMLWSDDKKIRFKAKIRLILEKLIRRCGYDKVSAVMPNEHMKHLANIRKRKEHEEKKKRSVLGDEEQSMFSRVSTSRSKHTDFFSDTDDENDGDDESEEWNTKSTIAKSRTTVRSKKLPKPQKRLPEDMLQDRMQEPLDLLDTAKTRAALSTLKSKRRREDDSDDEPLEYDENDRLIIPLDKDGNPINKRQRNDEEEDEADKKSKATSRQKSRPGAPPPKRRKSATGWSYKGEEYVNKKGAGGDLKKDGKLEPYAYWPLDAKLLNRRGEKKAAARKGMQSVVKVTKKLEGLSVNKALGAIQKRKTQNKAHKGGSKRAKK